MESNRVGKAIAFLRKRAGYTQKDLADRIGVSDKAVSKWERGVSLPDIAYLSKLSILLDTDSDSLLAGDVIHHDSGWTGLLVLEENASGISPLAYVYDKPLFHYQLGCFMLLGIKEVYVCCSVLDAEALKSEYGDGEKLGVRLRFVTRSVTEALELNELPKNGNVMVIYGRSIVFGVDQTRFFQRAMHDKSLVSVLALTSGKPASSNLAFDLDRRLVDFENPDRVVTQYGYEDLPIFFCPAGALAYAFDAEKDCFAPLRLSQNYDVRVEILDRGFIEMRICSWDDIEEASSFFKLVQRHCGMISYCIEEIAWRRGFISTEEMIALAKVCSNSDYRDYILGLAEAL